MVKYSKMSRIATVTSKKSLKAFRKVHHYIFALTEKVNFLLFYVVGQKSKIIQN